MQMRERANAMREKEKVCSVFSSLFQYGDYRVLGDNGYVPAVSETEVWLNGSRQVSAFTIAHNSNFNEVCIGLSYLYIVVGMIKYYGNEGGETTKSTRRAQKK